MNEINMTIVKNFSRKFGVVLSKRKAEWNKHIKPIFEHLDARVRNRKIDDLYTYEYLVDEYCTKLSERFPELQKKIELETEKILGQIKKRRDNAETKVKESKFKLGPFETGKKEERFPPK